MSSAAKFGTVVLATSLGIVVAWNVSHRSGTMPARGRAPVVAPAISPSAGKNIQTVASAVTDSIYPNPDASARDEELLALARKAVADFPLRAIDWARSQPDALLQRRLLSAVIQAWGEKDPATAIDWVLRQDDDERRLDMEAALDGAAQQPELALAIVRQLLVNDPSDPDGYGPSLIAALINAKQFEVILQFLNNGASPESRADWMAATFNRWGQTQPQQAIKALASLTDESLRASAFHSVMDGWSQDDPGALAAYGATLSPGADRDYAVKQALNNWSLQDPAAMATWLNQQPEGTEFDEAVALIISKTDSANCPPATAMSWVEGIGDSTLKLQSFMHVLDEWNQTDPMAAQQYAANVSWLDTQSRQKIIEGLKNPPPVIAASSD
ncbi:MAG TPA: hypothetical protein VGN23_00490 [Verrucomicrobiae bacterium]